MQAKKSSIIYIHCFNHEKKKATVQSVCTVKMYLTFSKIDKLLWWCQAYQVCQENHCFREQFLTSEFILFFELLY